MTSTPHHKVSILVQCSSRVDHAQSSAEELWHEKETLYLFCTAQANSITCLHCVCLKFVSGVSIVGIPGDKNARKAYCAVCVRVLCVYVRGAVCVRCVVC
ncbi:Hypothetical predicted protein [Pelobates cultripes]|uniref:Uncharacterized protein n=1 Tax=Pelobates cultripes TaxID=61616 RepID=A0AAD1QXQ8_PELCU|nr:Hypothetical predicted protein [Pelobates cultripes]